MVEYKKRLEREKEKERMEVPQIEYHEKKEKSRVLAHTEEPPHWKVTLTRKAKKNRNMMGNQKMGRGKNMKRRENTSLRNTV